MDKIMAKIINFFHLILLFSVVIITALMPVVLSVLLMFYFEHTQEIESLKSKNSELVQYLENLKELEVIE